MIITPIEKLLLSLQTASARQIAGAIGVSHTTIANWLKKGAVPDYAKDNLKFVYEAHKSTVSQVAQMREKGQSPIPYSNKIPILLYRMKRSKGEFRGKYGDHITTVDLSKIPQHLKDAFIKEMGFTGAFHQAYYQSIIDLDDYTGRYVDEKYAGSSKKKKSILIKKMREAFLNGWIGTDPDLSYQVPMHTGRESIDFTNNVDPEQAMKSIGIRLKRHEPSAVSLANKIFLQVYPSNYAKPKSNSPKSITPKKAKRK